MECENKCKKTQRVCEYCRKNYDVSSEMYRAKRPANGCWVIGYLVKEKKTGKIEGILSEATGFAELAWILPETLEKV